MILTPHILAGAAIATNISNPFLGLILAFLSHYFLDFIPHREYSIKNIKKRQWQKSFFDSLKIALDIFLGILIILFLTKKLFLAFTGSFFALLPDGFTLLFLIFPENKFLKKHYFFHSKKVHFFKDETNNFTNTNSNSNNKKIPLIWRILSQILTIIISILLIQ